MDFMCGLLEWCGCLLACARAQMYDEKVYDLLADKKNPLPIRECGQDGVQVASTFSTSSLHAFFYCLMTAAVPSRKLLREQHSRVLMFG